MNNWWRKDTISTGFFLGVCVIFLLYIVLRWLDNLFYLSFGRPFFTKPDALQLIILATLAVFFRQKFKSDSFEAGKGVFLATFIATMVYLLLKKINFAVWQDYD